MSLGGSEGTYGAGFDEGYLARDIVNRSTGIAGDWRETVLQNNQPTTNRASCRRNLKSTDWILKDIGRPTGVALVVYVLPSCEQDNTLLQAQMPGGRAQ